MPRHALAPAPPLACVIPLTVPPVAAGHHAPHLIANHFEERDMNKHFGSFSLRAAVEQVFAAVAFVATVAVVSAGTAAMCFPGLVA